MKKYMKIFQFRKIFQFMNLVNLDICYYLTMNCLIKFLIRLNILKVKKVVLRIILILILVKSELIHTIIYQLKNIDFSCCNNMTLIKSAVNKSKNEYF